MQATKRQENSTNGFAVNYLKNHLVKVMQDLMKPWRRGGFRVSSGHQFFYTSLIVKVLQITLTHHVIHVNSYHATDLF